MGRNGVELPGVTTDNDIVYACPENLQQNVISVQIFQNHLLNRSFPSVNSDALPPEHTIITEADIWSGSSRKGKTRVNREIRDMIIVTCGGATIETCNNKLVDPCLRVYV